MRAFLLILFAFASTAPAALSQSYALWEQSDLASSTVSQAVSPAPVQAGGYTAPAPKLPKLPRLAVFIAAAPGTCPPCEKWKTEALYGTDGLLDQGWSVGTYWNQIDLIRLPPGTDIPTPHFIWVAEDGSTEAWSGYTTRTAFYDQLQKAMTGQSSVTTAVPQVTATTTVPTPTHPTSTGPVYFRGYGTSGSQWSWPGDLASHLSGPNHRINPAGMSREEMIRLHDMDHNRYGYNPRAACPTGNCP